MREIALVTVFFSVYGILYFSSDLRLDVVYPIAFLEPAKQIHSLASQL